MNHSVRIKTRTCRARKTSSYIRRPTSICRFYSMSAVIRITHRSCSVTDVTKSVTKTPERGTGVWERPVSRIHHKKSKWRTKQSIVNHKNSQSTPLIAAYEISAEFAIVAHGYLLKIPSGRRGAVFVQMLQVALNSDDHDTSCHSFHFAI